MTDEKNRTTRGADRPRGDGARDGPSSSRPPAAPVNRRFIDLVSSAEVLGLPADPDGLKLLLIEAVAARSGAVAEADLQKRLHRSRRPQHRLTEAMLGKLAPNRRYSDGNGLYAVTSETGKVKWVSRLTVRGRRRDFGHGGWPAVSLDRAREKALAFLQAAREGRDPCELRRREVPIVDEVWESVIPNWRMSWKESLRDSQERSYRSLYKRVFQPSLGEVPVDQITPGQIAEALRPHWRGRGTSGYVAAQLFRRIAAFAVAHGYRKDNVADVGRSLLPKVKRGPKNFSAVPWQDAPRVFGAIRSVVVPFTVRDPSRFEVGRLALLFTILTAARGGEVRSARWDEIDFALQWEAGKVESTWEVPAERIKMGRDHKVPLSRQACAVLAAVRALGNPQGPEDLIFGRWGRDVFRELDDDEMLFVLRAAGGDDVTVHGWRSTFADWSSSTGAGAREVADAALAHADDSQVIRAYFRASLFGRRIPLMRAWGDYLENGLEPDGSIPEAGPCEEAGRASEDSEL